MILSNDKTMPSAKLLRDAICKEFGWESNHILVTKDPKKITKLHLRYGNSLPTRNQNRHRIVNTKSFIQLCANKKYLAKALKSRVSVNVPEFHRLNKNLPSQDNFPFLIRESLSSSGSKGIIIFQEYESFLEALVSGKIKYSWYWTPYFNFVEEFRVHLLGGKIAKIFRKQVEEAELEEDIFIRNNDNSHFYRLKLEKTPKNVVKLVDSFHRYMKTQSAKPIYFTALDIGIQENGEAVFIEANSAPGLNESTAELYAKYLITNCPIFQETKAEVEIAKKLKKATSNLNVEWAIEF